MSTKSEIVELFESDFMRHVVKEAYDSLDAEPIATIVAGSRATLAEKGALFDVLSADDRRFELYRNALRFALSELESVEDERVVWQVCSYWVDSSSPNHDHIEMSSCAVCASFEAAREGILREVAEEFDGDGSMETQEWYQVDKCVFTEDGQAQVRISYWCGLDGEPRYFSTEEALSVEYSKLVDGEDSLSASGGFALKREAAFFKYGFWPGPNSMPTALELPLEPGDVVMVDCMPYVKPQQAIVLDNSFLKDCCLPQVLTENRRGILQQGALKHAHVGDEEGQISPLYRLRKATKDELSAEPSMHELASLLKDSVPRTRFGRVNDFALSEFNAEAWVCLLGQEWLEEMHDTPLDPIDFIDSKDIREHCREIDWRPTALEAAYLIWQSKSRTLASKHAAWQLIIKTTPDMGIAEGRNRRAFPSLHGLLDEYMSLEKDVLHFIFSDDGSDTWCWIFKGTYRDGSTKSGLVCKSPSEALTLLATWIEWGDFERGADGAWPMSYSISKMRLGGSRTASVRLSEDLEPIDFPDVRACALTVERQRIWLESFMGMWIDMPVPFKAGDLLCYVPDAGYDERFVLSHGPLDPANECDAQLLARLLSDGDESDMGVSGYCVDSKDGFVHFHAHYPDVLQLGYCKDDFEGYERKLPHLSRFAKGEIGLEECMRLCDAVGAEVRAELDEKYTRDQKKEIAFQFGEKAAGCIST